MLEHISRQADEDTLAHLEKRIEAIGQVLALGRRFFIISWVAGVTGLISWIAGSTIVDPLEAILFVGVGVSGHLGLLLTKRNLDRQAASLRYHLRFEEYESDQE